MARVYIAIPGAPDRLTGHVDDEGSVYRSQTGFDDKVGRVDLASGNVYEQRFGPDKKIGHVDLSSGRVYATRLGSDEHVGQVNEDGKMHLHKALAVDDYIGNVDQFVSHAHTAGAMLLLVLPTLEANKPDEVSEDETEENTE